MDDSWAQRGDDIEDADYIEERRLDQAEMEMDWETGISPLAHSWMKFLGGFSPTAHEQKRELKGYMHDDEGGGKVYLDAGELRELASACNQAADWLDKRAESVPNAEITGSALLRSPG